MKKLRILVDMDSIVCDSLPYWLQKIANKTGVVAQVEDIKLWAMEKCPPLDKVDPKDIFGLLNEPGFIIGIPPMWGALDGLKRLIADGHEIYLVTARHGPVNMAETLGWVKKHLPFINVEKQLVFCYNKSLIPADIIIDDKAETLAEYKLVHQKTEPLLMAIKYPYNAHMNKEGVVLFDGHPDLTNTWGAMYGYIRSYAEEL